MVAKAYLDHLESFFNFIFEPLPAGYTIELRSINTTITRQLWRPNVKMLISNLSSITLESNIYFGVMPREDGFGSRPYLPTSGNILWADLDEKSGSTFADLLESPLPNPCAIVASGHGWHAYWKLTRPEILATIEDANANIAAILGSDNVGDAARIMRVPYTSNVKPGLRPIMSTIMQLEDDCRGHHLGSFRTLYSPDDDTFKRRARAIKKLELPVGHKSRSEGLFSIAIVHVMHGYTDLEELEVKMLAVPEGEKLYEMSPTRRKKWIELTYKNAKRALSKPRRV